MAKCAPEKGPPSDVPTVLCRLCLGTFSVLEMHMLQSCKCVYCKECLKQYLTMLIHEGVIVSITCPDALCKNKGRIDVYEVKQIVSNDDFEKFVRLKLQLEVELDPNRTWCPEIGCETICHVCVGEQANSRPVCCPTCGLNFCSTCKSKWHAPQTCDDYLKTLAPTVLQNDIGVPFSEADIDAPIKRCPMCHIPIERDEGCAQMMCKRCKHVFCWYCLKSLDDDFLLRHYDKGPCKNKLGHSRASVIWHRTQVIGIFAGFGVLLLVASPFLLLAAPCILCCKCKSWRCLDDDDEDPPPPPPPPPPSNTSASQ